MAGRWNDHGVPNFRLPRPPFAERAGRPNFRPRYSDMQFYGRRMLRPRLSHGTPIDSSVHRNHCVLPPGRPLLRPRGVQIQLSDTFCDRQYIHPNSSTTQTETQMQEMSSSSFVPNRPNLSQVQVTCGDEPNVRDNAELYKSESVTKEIGDLKWLHQWIDNTRSHKSTCVSNERPSNDMSIVEWKEALRRTLSLLEQLKSLECTLTKDISSEHDESIIQQANSLKTELDELKRQFGTVDNINTNFKKKIDTVKRKRARLKRKQQRLYEEKQERDETRQKQHEEIDKWQAQIYEQVQEMKMEEELKGIADKTLEEVRREVSETSRALDALHSVKKLRIARKQGLQQTGLYVSRESDAMFDQRHEALVNVMTKQLRKYQEEQRLLQLMLDSEKAELHEHDIEERQRRVEDKQQQCVTQIRAQLFASQEEYPPDHPLYSYFMYYDVANRSEIDLVRIRRDWDAFLVPENAPVGTCIPPGWVQPATPSSHVWASALQAEPD